MDKYDVIIIGSGPAGYKCASLLVKHGLRVVLIEKAIFGGTCLNSGCIPKDALYTIARGVVVLRKHGGDTRLAWNQVINKIQQRIAHIRNSALEVLKRQGLIFIEGEAKLLDERVVKVGKKELKANYIILACGSKPKDKGIYPEDILSGKIKPFGRILIEGGGASACELAFILSVFGFEVYVKYNGRLLDTYPQIPEAFSSRLEDSLESLGVEFVEEYIESDIAVKATGRVPNLSKEQFPLIELDKDGFVKTNEFLETNIKNIYAVGDLVPPMGAGYAFEKARIVVQNILFGKRNTFIASKVPVLISSALEVGFVGDFSAAKKFKTVSLSSNPKNYTTGYPGIMRVGYDDKGRAICLCAIGVGISEILNGFAIYNEYSFSHPSFVESLEEVL